MWKSLTLFLIALGVALTAPGSAPVTAQGQSMSFFVSRQVREWAAISADWPGQTSTARRSPRRPARAIARGVPTSAPRCPTSTLATGSEADLVQRQGDADRVERCGSALGQGQHQ